MVLILGNHGSCISTNISFNTSRAAATNSILNVKLMCSRFFVNFSDLEHSLGKNLVEISKYSKNNEIVMARNFEMPS